MVPVALLSSSSSSAPFAAAHHESATSLSGNTSSSGSSRNSSISSASSSAVNFAHPIRSIFSCDGDGLQMNVLYCCSVRRAPALHGPRHLQSRESHRRQVFGRIMMQRRRGCSRVIARALVELHRHFASMTKCADGRQSVGGNASVYTQHI